MEDTNSKVELGALYYPSKDWAGNDINFDNLFIPYIYKEIYLEGVYVDVMNGKKDLVIVDAGANIGITVQYFRNFAKKVYAIEPSPENFAALKKNKEFNNWNNVTLCNYALADKEGEMEFSMNEANRTMNGLVNNRDKKWMKTVGWKQTITVPTKSFKQFMDENEIDEIDFCKFDTEGNEDSILRTESFREVSTRIKAIEIELHNADWPDLIQYMVSLGYTARRYPSSAVIVLLSR